MRPCASAAAWLTDEAIAAWQAEPRTTRSGQSRCPSIIGLDPAVPDHPTLSRRAGTLEVVQPQPGAEAVRRRRVVA